MMFVPWPVVDASAMSRTGLATHFDGEPGHERYYKTEVTLDDTEDDNEKLLAAATSFVEKYFEGKLKPEVTEN